MSVVAVVLAVFTVTVVDPSAAMVSYLLLLPIYRLTNYFK